jgi:Mg2+ and Co2+ transporter CorA
VTAPPGTSIEARLYDARGEDREVDVLRDPPRRVRDDQLLWIDVIGRDPAPLRSIAAVAGIDPRTVELLADARNRPLLRRHDTYLHVGLGSAEPGPDEKIVVVGLDLVAAPNLVVTVRDGPVGAFERFRDEIDGLTQVGRLDTATFTAALVDSILAGYLELVEDLERRVDELDDAALTARRPAAVLDELASLRRRAAALRRALAPHRQAFSALARPDAALQEALGRPWPGLLDRLDTTLAAIETARDLLLGTYDLLMTRVAQRTNDTMKTLTVLSAVLLPASLVSSVLGMNFALPLFDDLANFWWALAAMGVLMVGTLGVALFRDRP